MAKSYVRCIKGPEHAARLIQLWCGYHFFGWYFTLVVISSAGHGCDFMYIAYSSRSTAYPCAAKPELCALNVDVCKGPYVTFCHLAVYTKDMRIYSYWSLCNIWTTGRCVSLLNTKIIHTYTRLGYLQYCRIEQNAHPIPRCGHVRRRRSYSSNKTTLVCNLV